jgi:hypothetical protein
MQEKPAWIPRIAVSRRRRLSDSSEKNQKIHRKTIELLGKTRLIHFGYPNPQHQQHGYQEKNSTSKESPS